MEPDFFPFFVFVLGVLTEAFITLQQKGKGEALKTSFLIFGTLSLFLVLTSFQGGSNYAAVGGIMLVATLMFVFYFSFAYRKDALPRINERILLPFTVLFWFILFNLWSGLLASQLVLILFLIPTIAVLYSSFTTGETGILSKLIFYLWFIFLSIVFLSFQVSATFSNIFHPENEAFVLAYLFLGGMVFLRLSVFIFTVFAIFHIPNFGAGLKNDYPEIMIGKYSEEELPPLVSAIIIFGLGGGLALVNFLGVFPADLLVTVSILLASHLAPTS